MKAKQLVRNRIALSGDAYAETVVWQLPAPLAESTHSFKYRLAYLVGRAYVLRYDNESGKGDHCHFDSVESVYTFTTPDKLMADFFNPIERWNHEHNHD